jgi:hypothetical protein
MAVRHRHFWLLRDNYLQCELCGKVKIQGKTYPSLHDFVLEFLQVNFEEIFGGLLHG